MHLLSRTLGEGWTVGGAEAAFPREPFNKILRLTLMGLVPRLPGTQINPD